MEQAEIAKAVGIFLLSAVKLLFAPGAAVAAGFSEMQAVVITSVGGCAGITLFYFAGHWATNSIRDFYYRHISSESAEELKLKARKVFTRRNRWIVRVKYNFGMLGLALLTPAVISIPIGAVLSARYFYGNRWMYPLLLISTIFWCFVLTHVAVSVKQNLFQP